MTGVLSKLPDDASVRTFLALELSSEVRNSLARLESEFAAHTSSVKWISADLLHITVRFLGNVPASSVTHVVEAARTAAHHIEPFHLRVSGLGAFPGDRAPRVIWAGIHGDEGKSSLQRLFVSLEHELAARGFRPEERSFSAHITLGRVREGTAPALRRQIGETLSALRVRYPLQGTMAIRDLIVMRSDLGLSGPRYTPIARAVLGPGEGRDHVQ